MGLNKNFAAVNFSVLHAATMPCCLLLLSGAGNQVPVVALDILHMLFAEDRVVLAKMNPVNDYYGPLLRQVRQMHWAAPCWHAACGECGRICCCAVPATGCIQ
jgi:hypothetical protein